MGFISQNHIIIYGFVICLMTKIGIGGTKE